MLRARRSSSRRSSVKTRAGAKRVDAGRQGARGQSEARAVGALPVLAPIGEASEPAEGLGALVVRVELGPFERPPAQRPPLARLEVDGVQRRVLRAHLVAEGRVPDPGLPPACRCRVALGTGVGVSRRGAVAQRLGRGVGISSAALEEHDPPTARGELARESQPGRARPHDADVGVEDGAPRVRDPAHGAPSIPGRHDSPGTPLVRHSLTPRVVI